MESYVTYPCLVELCCIRVPYFKNCLPVSINMDGVSLEFGRRHGSTDEQLGSNTPQVGTFDVTSKQNQNQKTNKQKDKKRNKQKQNRKDPNRLRQLLPGMRENTRYISSTEGTSARTVRSAWQKDLFSPLPADGIELGLPRPSLH